MPGPRKQPARLALVTADRPKIRAEISQRVALEPSSGNVKPPNWLDGRPLELWKELAPQCVKMGTLTDLDVVPFADLCVVLSQLEECNAQLKKDGLFVTGQHDYLVRHPATTVAKQCRDALVRYYDRFGIGAAARASLPLPADSDKKDPWEKPS